MNAPHPATYLDAYDAGLFVICGRHFPGMSERFAGMNPRIHEDGCGELVNLASAYRCLECDAFFHRPCARAHFQKHTAERTCPACGAKTGGGP